MVPQLCDCEKDLNEISLLIYAIESHIWLPRSALYKLGDTVEQLLISMSSIDQTR
jgi:hypothetical protein